MRLLALKASLPGMLKELESASPAGFIAASPAIATAIQRPTTSFLWPSTHRVRVVIALRLDIGFALSFVCDTYAVSRDLPVLYTYAVSTSRWPTPDLRWGPEEHMQWP